MPQAIGTGIRFVALSPGLVAVMVRASAFGLCGSGLWALTAVLARDALGTGPGGFGVLLGGFGVGAVVGAFVRTMSRSGASGWSSPARSLSASARSRSASARSSACRSR